MYDFYETISLLFAGSSRSYRSSSHRSRDDTKSKHRSDSHRSSSSRRKDDKEKDRSKDDKGKDKKDSKRKSSSNRSSTSKNSSPSHKSSSSKTTKSKSPTKKEGGCSAKKPESDEKPIKTIEEANRQKHEREHKENERLEKEKQRIEKEKQREERRIRERERERKIKEERQMEQERRERERRERARKEAERVRKERERQRELEKAREREREKERERFIRERKEREEKERREKEREREMFERERLERERIERERKERERLEAERMERERQERQRLEREKLEREARVEKERLRLEREDRMERERIEREQRYSMSQGMKRSNPDYNRYPESKRSYRTEPEQSRKPFFGGAANPTDMRGNLKDDMYDMAYRRNVVDSKKERDYGEPRDFEGRRRSDPRGFPPPSHKEPSDIRRVVENANNRYPPTRERSPHRPQQYENRNESARYNNNTRGPEYERRDKTWLDAPNPNAPKTLSDVLGRAGLTGILGSKAEDNTRDREAGFAREPERGYGGAPLRNERPERNDYSRNPPAREDPYKLDNRQVEERRVVHPERRDTREGYRVENARRESRPEERRFDDRRREGGEHHRDPYMNDRGKDTLPRREPTSSYGGNDHREKDTYGGVDRKDPYLNSNRKPERATSSRHDIHEKRDTRPDERRDSRSDERRDTYRTENTKPIDRGISRQPPSSSTSQPRPDNRSVTERRGLHPLAAEIAGRSLPTIMQQQSPRVVGPSTSVYGRVMPQQPSLRPGFPPAGSQPVTVQVPPAIQLRDGRLEFTRVAPPGANIQPFPRRF